MISISLIVFSIYASFFKTISPTPSSSYASVTSFLFSKVFAIFLDGVCVSSKFCSSSPMRFDFLGVSYSLFKAYYELMLR